MTATAYYNEIDPFAAAWLQNLINAGCIAPGVVDTRSIEEVTANDLKGFTQCHFFAGIGVWSYALRCAGWPDSRPVWTGSCPCQPFSQPGKRRGFNDPRHLWPAWFYLVSQCRPDVIFGEQVASKDGLTWFDAVQFDLEKAEYAVAVVDLCAAGFGSAHIRQRLFWVADAAYKQHQECLPGREESHCPQSGRSPAELTGYCLPDGLAHTNKDSSKRRLPGREDSPREVINGSAGCGSTDSGTCPVNGYWRDADWLFCRDGKWRPVKPGLKPLVNGTPGRVGQLRAYGNAIVVPVAEAFIRAYMEAVTP
ncbi:DNA cytosine methyltransferase [Salmonella enterica subsp. enterica serovar Luciana]|nr:DNA cytosine methyltransferase [Salmonella enterica]EDK5734139.1 DNA cytosine methyltransferase [Salmonella enterica subsp. enterica serovar Muenchen]EDX3294273.1 DNA cytosine methyltransferase [Salmonella enterica subsp. enterica serovar Luciana]EEF1122607.1 DNA cytosine methyltransferase [Salmonella enterica subsp. enterica serovar Rubislaw]ECJ8916243.1 DNA cytosine methyltransferase [Salmonella enterica]